MDCDWCALLSRFSTLNVLVIGESIVDSMVSGKAGRLSLEAPAPVVDVTSTQAQPGGAANVALTVARLGANARLLSVVGQDAEGDWLMQYLQENQVDVNLVIRDADRETLLRRRIYAEAQLLVRYDQGSQTPITEAAEERLFQGVTTVCPEVDLVILSDYGQGIFTPGLLEKICQYQKQSQCLFVADTRRLEAFRGLRLAAVRPGIFYAFNRMEEDQRLREQLHLGEDVQMGDQTGGDTGYLEMVEQAGKRIFEMLDTQIVSLTFDHNGALVIDRDAAAYRTYAAQKPFNLVPGVGDAFISGLALSLAAGGSTAIAGEIGSAVATIVVEKEGQSACCVEELQAYLSGDQKIIEDWQSLKSRLENLHKQGKKIVFTNGVFDILHSAHVTYLNQAKSFGDALVIGVNSDESVHRLKGLERPINHLMERMRVLAGLSCVDFVVPFSENTPIDLIHVIQPDIYVKGGDYRRETLPEAEIVEQYGGQLRIVPYLPDHSTTSVIERIRKLYVNSGSDG